MTNYDIYNTSKQRNIISKILYQVYLYTELQKRSFQLINGMNQSQPPQGSGHPPVNESNLLASSAVSMTEL